MEFIIYAISVSGSAACPTYWKNAWNAPTLILPRSSRLPPSTASSTCPTRLMRRMAGLMASTRKSALRDASASRFAAPCSAAEDAASRQNALTTVRPE